jgi:polysaccharide export outer membrane protein
MGKLSKTISSLCHVAMVIMISGCATHGGKIAYDQSNFGAPDKIAVPQRSADYHLGVGDVVTLRVYKVDSMSGDQTIDAGGQIDLPLVGDVQAAGLTTAELETRLKTTLGAKYLTAPSVSVTLKSAIQRTVTVDGSVQQPGLYPVQPTTTLIQTIAMARGTADGANPRRVVIFRQISGQRMAAAFDLVNIRHGESPDPAVYADDIIVVDGSALSKALKTTIQSLPFLSMFGPF